MPRFRVRSTDRGVAADLLERASKSVEVGRSIRSAAQELSIPVASLAIRKLAFELASFYGLSFPAMWAKNGMASESWFSNFMRRHQQLSIRRPQATSLSRATSFNPTNVATFFDKLATVLSRDGFTAKDIWNMDETGLTTVQNPARIFATKGERRVGSVTSAERGVLVTMALAGNALGNITPPFRISKEKVSPTFHQRWSRGLNCTANGSGWMQEQDFVVFLQHFVQYTRATEDNKVLLLLDNHSSHVSIAAVNFCRANGVVLLSFPPHCTHQLQPLDRTVYGPLKKHLNSEMDKWHRRHPGTTITIYDLPEMVKKILLLAASPQNVKKGFQCTGIWPYNKNIFSEVNFLPAYVTDRPPPVPSLPGPSTAAPPSLPGPSTAAPPSLPGPSTAAPPSLPGPSTAAPPSLPGPSTAAPPSLPGPSTAAPPSLPGPSTATQYHVPSLDIPIQ
ncbi:tigger transposable element-derived protein 1-like [Pseudorasbora parva]|uniref:tigger transposable element-derived protein 1-like n=1 Tax=Pseudorasbora parva TaxID=51549 RepID=UPI00351E0AC1